MTAKVSVGSSTFCKGAYAQDPISLEDVIIRLGELGYDGLELPADPGYGSIEDWPDTTSRKKLMKLMGDAGLEISSYGADLSSSPFYSNDACVRSAARVVFEKSIELCADCEIPVIRVDTLAEPPEPPDVSYDDAWGRAVEVFRNYAEFANRHGVVVAWEFEPGFMFNKPGEVVEMIQEVGHPNFTVMFDYCHAHMSAAKGARHRLPHERLDGGALELARRLKGHIGCVHLIDSDNTLYNDMTSTHAPFGTGVLDVKELTLAMLEAGYKGPWWTIDLCFWPESWEELEPSLKFVRNLLKELKIS